MITLSSFSCLSVVSFAAIIAEDGEYNDENQLVKLHWELDDAGVLTIHANVDEVTWSVYASQIKEVVVKGSVGKIPDFAFADYPNLAKVTFELAVGTIGKGAFQNCDGLKEIVLSVTDGIGDYAFYDCDGLENVVIKSGFSGELGKNIFKSCDALKSVVIPNGTLAIGEGMFEDCIALENIELPDSIVEIGRLAFENCAALTSIFVPDSTEVIGEYAFYDCGSAKTAYIGHNVKEVGEYAFGKCAALESVEIKCAMPVISEGMFYGCSSLKGLSDLPEGIKTIGKNAFKDCTNFAEITLPSTVMEIGDSAFDATAITSIDIPVGVQVIGSGAFTNCNKLAAINVSTKNRYYASVDGILYSADFSELICCPAAKSGNVVVTEGTEKIGNDAFIGCTLVESVEIPDSVEEIATNAFNGCSDSLVIKANCDSYAASYAKLYAINTEITHSTISDWIVTVEPDCDNPGVKEKQCVACGNVEDTGIVDAIGHKYDDGVVTKKADCENDGVVKFTCQNPGCDASYTEVIPATGHNYDDGTVTLEPTCDTDGLKVFRCKNEGCYSYKEIVLPATGHKMDDGTVKVEATCTTDGEKVYKCKDATCNYEVKEVIPAFGHKYDDGVVTLEPDCENTGVKTYTCEHGCGDSYTETLPATGHSYDDGVITKYPTVNANGELTYTCQNEWCTEDCANHTYVVVIPNIAFAGIIAANEDAYADEKGNIQNLKWLITDAYDLYIYEDDTAEEWASYRNSVKTVTFTKNATTVENGSFAYMNALTEANILFNLGKIEAYAFQYCENLKTVYTGSLDSIEEFAFYNCTSLEDVDIYGGLPEGNVGRNVFLNCKKLSNVILRNGTLSIGSAMFKGCTSLEEIVLPESLLAIGDSAFDGTSLKEINIPTDVQKIEKGVFTHCLALEAINVDDKNDFYFSVDGVLYDMTLASLLLCPAAKTGAVAVWNGTTTIAEDAFIGCDKVTKVTIPNSVTKIADNAFNGCSSDLVIVCNCDSVAAEFAKARGIDTEINHVAEDVWQITAEADCINDGKKERVCSACGYSYETEVILALGHKYDKGVVTTDVTCDADGVKTFTCTRTGCDDTYTEVIPALGHDYDEGVVTKEPTCDEDGVKKFTCKNDCGSTYTEVISAIGHNYDAGVVTKEPTCEAEGVKTFTCKNNCGSTYTEAIPAIGHNYDEGVVTKEPTCEAEGVKTFTCKNCGTTYTEAISAIGHDYDEGVVTLEPTCGVEGVKTFTCKNGCGATYTEAISALKHKYVKTVVREGTCITKGIVEYKCENCGDTYTERNYGDHKVYSYTVKIDPTCDTEGKEGNLCALCHEFVGKVTVIPAKSHTESKWIVDKKATCTTKGSKHKECVDCGVVLSKKSIAALGHSEGDWVTDKKATVNAAGKKHKDCTVCGETLKTATIKQLICSKPKLKSIENTEYGVLIKWSKVSGADRYRVYRKTSKGDWTYIGYTSNSYYTDKTAKSGTKYYYAIKARNEAGNSSLSSSLSKYYLADPSLKSATSTKSGVKLEWSKVTGAEGYIVYRKTGSGNFELLKIEKGVSNTSYTDKSAKKGKRYTYKVKAFYSKTKSDYSKTKVVTDKY